MSARPAEFPGSTDGRLTVAAAPGSLTLTRTTHDFGAAKTILLACIALGLCFGTLGLFVGIGFFGMLFWVVMLILGLVAAATYAAAMLRPTTIEITLNTRDIVKSIQSIPLPARRAPAIISLTPLMGSRTRYRGEPDGPESWQWLMLVSSIVDGPVEQMLVGAAELREVNEAVSQAGPLVVQLGNPENTLLPWVTVCPQCAYDLVGIGQPRCPECGRPISPDNLRHLQALAQERRSASS